MPITEQHQASALAKILAILRPNDWRPNQTLEVLYEHRNDPHPLPNIIEAAIRAARNPAIRSPEGIFLPGKHWEQDDYRPEFKTRPCPDHPEESQHNCRCCWADVRAGDRPQTHIGRTWTPDVVPTNQHHPETVEATEAAQEATK